MGRRRDAARPERPHGKPEQFPGDRHDAPATHAHLLASLRTIRAAPERRYRPEHERRRPLGRGLGRGWHGADHRSAQPIGRLPRPARAGALDRADRDAVLLPDRAQRPVQRFRRLSLALCHIGLRQPERDRAAQPAGPAGRRDPDARTRVRILTPPLLWGELPFAPSAPECLRDPHGHVHPATFWNVDEVIGARVGHDGLVAGGRDVDLLEGDTEVTHGPEVALESGPLLCGEVRVHGGERCHIAGFRRCPVALEERHDGRLGHGLVVGPCRSWPEPAAGVWRRHAFARRAGGWNRCPAFDLEQAPKHVNVTLAARVNALSIMPVATSTICVSTRIVPRMTVTLPVSILSMPSLLATSISEAFPWLMRKSRNSREETLTPATSESC